MDTETATIIDSIVEPSDPTIFVSKNNIKFKLNKVSKMLIVEAGRKIKEPKPPKWFNEEKGRHEENPLDPEYVEELSNVNWKRGSITIAVYLTMGCKVIELPPEIEPVNSEEWVETLAELGVEVSKNPKSRFVEWLKYYAIEDDDLSALVTQIMAISGIVLEKEVKEAEATFRS